MSLATSSPSRSPAGSAKRRTRRASSSSHQNPLFQDILVFQDDSEASLSALRYAQTLATSSDGNVTGVVFGLLAEYPMTVYAETLPSTWLALQAKANEEAEALEKSVAARIKKTRIATDLRRVNVMGSEAGGSLAGQAHYADLVVVGFTKSGGTDFENLLFEGALFGSGKPLILVPEAFSPPRMPARVVIGWRATREAARAVQDAMPILQAAEAVLVLVVDERGKVPEGQDPGADIARYLARHDVKVEVKHVPGSTTSVSRILSNEMRYFGADLLVLGGYGHSRFREWLLGGVTRDILTLTETPVLFSH